MGVVYLFERHMKKAVLYTFALAAFGIQRALYTSSYMCLHAHVNGMEH